MILLAALISLGVLGVASRNWRNGILALFVVGLAADPLRKLSEGLPGYYIIWVAVLFGAIWLQLLGRGRLVGVHRLALGNNHVRRLGRWLFVLLILHSLHSLVRWGNPAIPMLGLLFYLAPVIALSVGWSFARNLDDVQRFLTWYAALTIPVALTVYLSPSYQDAWPVLKEVGKLAGHQLLIYDVGTVLESYSGLFRVGEFAAWHAATAGIFLVILISDRAPVAAKIVAVVLVALLIGVIVLTGRRKMLMALSIFIVFQWALLGILRKGAGKLFIAGLLLGVAGMVSMNFLQDETQSSLYLERGVSVYSGADERALSAIDLLVSAFYRGDGIGLGVGVTSQGSTHVGGSEAAIGGSGEAGVGKIMVELGIFGFVLIVGLLAAFGRRVWGLLRFVARFDSRRTYYCASLASFLVANFATFTVATQLYNDPFVLILLGLSSGMLISVLVQGVMVAQQRLDQKPSLGMGH